MPLYEYKCHDCKQRVSTYRTISDSSPVSCPICGSERVERLMPRFSVVKSGKERIRDLSWIDRDITRRLGKAGSSK